MRRVFLFGVVSAALASLVIVVGDLLNLPLQNVLFGIAGGATLGLVRTHSPIARYVAFLLGFLLGFVFYAIRLAVLPATVWGNLVAVVIIILAITTISALTRDKIPMWAQMVGVTMFAGSYDGYFNTTPWLFLEQSVSAGVATLFAVTAGFALCVLVELRVKNGVGSPEDPMEPATSNSASNSHNSESSPDKKVEAGLAGIGIGSQGKGTSGKANDQSGDDQAGGTIK